MNSRKSETYNIKVLSDIHDDLTRSPEILPQVTGITSHEMLLDIMHAFQNMASELEGKLYVTRTIYFWCDRCGAYMGSRDVEYIAERFQCYSGDTAPSMVVDTETEMHRCLICKEVTEFYFEPVLHLLY